MPYLDPIEILVSQLFNGENLQLFPCKEYICEPFKMISVEELSASNFTCNLLHLRPQMTITTILNFTSNDFNVVSNGTNSPSLSHLNIQIALQKSTSRKWTLECRAVNPYLFTNFPGISPAIFSFFLPGLSYSSRYYYKILYISQYL